MIVPMKKVLLLVLADEREKALEALRELGVMQVTLAEKLSTVSQNAGEELETLHRLVNTFRQLTQGVPEETELPAPKLSGKAAAEKLKRLIEERAVLSADAEAVKTRLKTLAVLGDFDKKLLDELNARGVRVIPCLGSRAEFEAAELLEDAECRLLSRERGSYCFVVLSLGEVDTAELPVFKLGDADDPRALKRQAAELERKLGDNLRELVALRPEMPRLAGMMDELAAKLEFCRVRDAVGEYGEIATLGGFVPEPEVEKLRERAKREGWGLSITDPAPDDDVPVLVKYGNFYTKTVKPLFDFLGITPGYREIDVSGGVLFFFTIFYAIIVGDAGYGALFLVLSLVLGLKFRRDKSKRPLVALLTLLSVATIVWGALSGQWFGFEWGGIKWLTDPKVKNANVQILCFVLAVAQLSLGHMWKAFKERSWRSLGANLGWMLIIWGNFFLAFRVIVKPGDFPVFMYYLYGVGLALVVLFSVNWRDPAGIFQFPFDVIGSFTDVLSYIRLFAVGMAGASIAFNFNKMGFDVAKSSPYFIVFGVLVVLIGHLLNLALCVMSVLVHAIRLNTLEFSNHSGLTWSGSAFKPFAKPNNDKEDKQS